MGQNRARKCFGETRKKASDTNFHERTPQNKQPTTQNKQNTNPKISMQGIKVGLGKMKKKEREEVGLEQCA